MRTLSIIFNFVEQMEGIGRGRPKGPDPGESGTGGKARLEWGRTGGREDSGRWDPIREDVRLEGGGRPEGTTNPREGMGRSTLAALCLGLTTGLSGMGNPYS